MFVNNKQVLIDEGRKDFNGNNMSSLSGLIPVSNGDVVKYECSNGPSINYKTAYFISGKWI